MGEVLRRVQGESPLLAWLPGGRWALAALSQRVQKQVLRTEALAEELREQVPLTEPEQQAQGLPKEFGRPEGRTGKGKRRESDA